MTIKRHRSGIEAATLDLPEYKHVPGINPRPDCSFLESIASQAHAVTEDCTAIENIAWHYGIRLLNAGYYWESHEVLEAVWLNASPNSRERYLLQAVIHLANARLKQKMSRHNAVVRLSKLATDCVHRAWPTVAADRLMGISSDQLSQQLSDVEQGCAVGSIELTFQ